MTSKCMYFTQYRTYIIAPLPSCIQSIKPLISRRDEVTGASISNKFESRPRPFRRLEGPQAELSGG